VSWRAIAARLRIKGSADTRGSPTNLEKAGKPASMPLDLEYPKINDCRCCFASIRLACIPTRILDSSTSWGPRQSRIHRQFRNSGSRRSTRKPRRPHQKTRSARSRTNLKWLPILHNYREGPIAQEHSATNTHTHRSIKNGGIRKRHAPLCLEVLAAMMVGNPNAGKRTATAAVALLLMIILVTVIISLRKKTAPAKEPPLHPSMVILAIF
jgi:hypothetical protein